MGSYDRGEPAVSYRWTGWVCEITGWSSKITDRFNRIYRIHPKLVKENRRMWTCNRSDLHNTRISTSYDAQKSPRSLVGSILGNPMCRDKIERESGTISGMLQIICSCGPYCTSGELQFIIWSSSTVQPSDHHWPVWPPPTGNPRPTSMCVLLEFRGTYVGWVSM